ncbi:AAEL002190-PA [Aedes aegypti]|uniref:AAEL002190-PA n=1 Tax=Aedes aegypti TaxID=7159 RepID=Q17IU4_AEDAE|nr:AAEL002190-PA [Aedes aegypti]
MFKLFRSVIRLETRWPSASALYSTFRRAEFHFETSDGESGTLIHRFSRHIALTKRDFTDQTRFQFKYSSFYPVYRPDQFLEQLAGISSHDMGKLICMTSDFRGKADIRMYTDVVNALDEECEFRVDRAEFRELVGMMHGFMYLLPNKITKLKAYRKAMPRLVEMFGSNVNRKDFMTILFFLGLWKKNAAGSRLMEQFIGDYLGEFLNEEMERMDFVILANALYKTSVRIKDEQFRNRLVEEIATFEDKDMALFVTLVKCARMNRIHSDRIADRFRNLLQGESQSLDFRGLAHLFAYVADNLIKDDTLTELFLGECRAHIEAEILTQPEKSDLLPQNFRAKDLATFLWSCSTLSIALEDLEIDAKDLKDVIFRKIDNDEYRYIPDTLVDTCLSLWLMGHPSVDLMSSIFGDRQMTQHFAKDRAKIESRRDLLLACAEIERPEAFKIISKLSRVRAYQLERPAPDYLVKNRRELQRVHSCLQSVKDKLQIGEIELNLPIRALNIAGLLVRMDNGDIVNLDVLDRAYCLSDRETPSGLMVLKQRLLNKAGVETHVVNSLQIESDDALTQTLEATIQWSVKARATRESRKAG